MPTVNVTPEAYEAFSNAVHAKHGKLRGVLMDEASEALLRAAKNLKKP